MNTVPEVQPGIPFSIKQGSPQGRNVASLPAQPCASCAGMWAWVRWRGARLTGIVRCWSSWDVFAAGMGFVPALPLPHTMLLPGRNCHGTLHCRAVACDPGCLSCALEHCLRQWLREDGEGQLTDPSCQQPGCALWISHTGNVIQDLPANWRECFLLLQLFLKCQNCFPI